MPTIATPRKSVQVFQKMGTAAKKKISMTVILTQDPYIIEDMPSSQSLNRIKKSKYKRKL